ncbi:sulfotransferase family protein [Hyphococcus sp.]|uniref:sulfotransferase family protein n=1 Tax=Hyphococcus sp. TaxID=2038636 RepID=UPI00208111B5|nr:MAG: hypothetical protein DHS20C04_13380 [Marinicaulis sp.]
MSDRARERGAPQPTHRIGAGIVFAGGCPRSGLTLLRRFLARHPDILAGPDTAIAPSVAFQWRHFAQSLGSLHKEYFDLEPAAVSAILGRFLEGALRAEHERRIILEKTSVNVAAFEALADMMPHAKFIHVVRDGRDVAASLLQRDWRDPATGHPFAHVSDANAAITYWASLIATGIAAERKLRASGRVLRVRYEDIVLQPEATVTTILNFIGAEWPPSKPLDPPLVDSDYRGMERDSLPLLQGAVTRTRVGRYKTDFPSSLLRQIEESGGPALTALGYL